MICAVSCVERMKLSLVHDLWDDSGSCLSLRLVLVCLFYVSMRQAYDFLLDLPLICDTGPRIRAGLGGPRAQLQGDEERVAQGANCPSGVTTYVARGLARGQATCSFAGSLAPLARALPVHPPSLSPRFHPASADGGRRAPRSGSSSAPNSAAAAKLRSRPLVATKARVPRRLRLRLRRNRRAHRLQHDDANAGPNEKPRAKSMCSRPTQLGLRGLEVVRLVIVVARGN